MRKQKNVIWILIGVVLIALIVKSQYPKLFLATGYGAKAMATAVFISGRDPQVVQSYDLNYSLVKYTTNKIDFKNKSVTTSFWGMAKQTAVYREGLGCTLINDSPIDSLVKFSFSIPRLKRPGIWRIPWPNGELKKDTVFPEIDTLKLKSAVDRAFGSPDVDKRWTAAVVVCCLHFECHGLA